MLSGALDEKQHSILGDIDGPMGTCKAEKPKECICKWCGKTFIPFSHNRTIACTTEHFKLWLTNGKKPERQCSESSNS